MPYTHTLGDSDGDAATVIDDRLPDLTAPAGSDRHGAPVGRAISFHAISRSNCARSF